MMFYLSNYVGAGVLDSPPPSTFHIIVYHTNLDNRTNVGSPFRPPTQIRDNSNHETPLKRDVEGAVPYILASSSTAAKSLRSLRILLCTRG